MLISLSLNITLPDGRKVEKPCLEWFLHQLRWRWLMDSFEGGEAVERGLIEAEIDAQLGRAGRFRGWLGFGHRSSPGKARPPW